MQWTDRIRQVKIILVVAAVLIAVASLFVSNYLVSDLYDEERTKMEVWAEAMRSFNMADENTDLNLVLKVMDENHTIPVIILIVSFALLMVATIIDRVKMKPLREEWLVELDRKVREADKRKRRGKKRS